MTNNYIEQFEIQKLIFVFIVKSYYSNEIQRDIIGQEWQAYVYIKQILTLQSNNEDIPNYVFNNFFKSSS